MVIRRIRDHVADHNWFAVGIDFLIVVAGIVIGTQVNNWNEARINRAEAADYRARIIADVKINEADTASRIIYYRQVRRHAVAALRALQHPDQSLSDSFLVDAYQASQSWLRPFERTAYDELVASGIARDVADARTRAELSSYYVSARGFDLTIRTAPPYRERIRTLLDFDVQDKIRRRCDDIFVNFPNGGQGIRLPDSCDLELDPAIIARAVGRLRAVPGLEGDLTRQIGDLDQKLLLFDRTHRSARKLVAALKK